MNLIRASIKLVLFLITTLFLYSMIMLCLAGSIVGLNYEKLRGYLLQLWGKSCCVILGIKINLKNNPPEPPFLLVSNHLSYIDIFVLFSQVRCLFVAKSDVKTWPFIGFIIRTCGILFIDRERKRDVTRVNQLISKNINRNQGIILFPEGTTSPGMDILPFRAPLLEYPASQDFSVTYVAISYSTEDPSNPAYQSVCWWDDTPFMIHFLNLLKVKKINVKMHFGKDKVKQQNRKELAVILEDKIRTVFTPVISKEEFYNRHDSFKPALPV